MDYMLGIMGFLILGYLSGFLSTYMKDRYRIRMKQLSIEEKRLELKSAKITQLEGQIEVLTSIIIDNQDKKVDFDQRLAEAQERKRQLELPENGEAQ